MSHTASPIVIVTGANGGVGSGICQRLLTQLCMIVPSDSYPLSSTTFQDEKMKGVIYEGVTLIMACRSVKKGEAAKSTLLKWFDGHVGILEKEATSKGSEHVKNLERIRRFKANCRVEVAELDLASFSSVLKFASDIRQRVRYVSHLIFNAGFASFKGLDWIGLLKQSLTDPIGVAYRPKYLLQHTGEKSADNLGWVWQANLFGHFALFRELEPLLLKAPIDGARVIWSSSLEASPEFYDSDDWQLVKTEHSYGSVKHQIDLIATTLDQAARNSPQSRPARHFVSEPGVCLTAIGAALVTPLTEVVRVIMLYLYRFFGYPYFSIVPYKSAIANVYLILAPLAFIPLFLANDPNQPVRYGARTDRWGHERVGLTPVKEWTKYKDEGQALVKKCDVLYQRMRAEELAPPVSETASDACNHISRSL